MQRFIVLSASRSGSNLLISLLNSHGQIRCEGEVLHDGALDRIHWANAQHETRPGDLELRETDPIAFLERRVFAPLTPEIVATGFKIFYWHCERAPWQPVWSWLAEQRDLEVVHLVRRNQLERVVSNEVAQATRRWHIQNDADAHEDVHINLDPDRCRAEFERFEQQRTDRLGLFRDRPIHEVTYEDLAGDPSGAGGDVVEFLGLERRPLATRARKQMRQPMRDVVTNWDALCEAFAGSKWAGHFE